MVFRKIDVDETIWELLKKNAEPFEDTPNSVLHRLLIGIEPPTERPVGKAENKGERWNFPVGTPRALMHTLEVIFEVRKHGLLRNDATNLVARREGVAPQTIIDKYCRQLGKRAHEIDGYLSEKDLSQFKALLKLKFPMHSQFIEQFFSKNDLNN